MNNKTGRLVGTTFLHARREALTNWKTIVVPTSKQFSGSYRPDKLKN